MKVLAAATVLLSVLGSTEAGKIVGGEPAPKGRYPWIVGLTNSVNSRFPYCGGTLIADNLVLTAAHCPTPNYVWIGCTDMDNKAECETISVSRGIQHPNYVSRPVPQNDFRLLELRERSVNHPIPNIAGADWNPIANTAGEAGAATTIGWGTTRSGGSQSADLLEVSVPLVSNDVCDRAYGRGYIDDTMICAGDMENGGIDACQGDSGGPLIVKCDGSNADVLIGVVSWGFGCADVDYPGVYGRVDIAAADGFLNGRGLVSINEDYEQDATERCGGRSLPTSRPTQTEFNPCKPWRTGCSALINEFPPF